MIRITIFSIILTMNNVLFAFGLTLFAGLATGIGSLLAFFTRQTNTKFLAASLGFSAGVMIYVSMVEIFIKAKDSLVEVVGSSTGYWYTTLAFFAGIAVIAIIDNLVPSYENPHEARSVEDLGKMPDETGKDETAKEGTGEDENEKAKALKAEATKKSLLRMGLFSALAIAIHNFPEGLATFTGALKDPTLGISIAVAIAIHNIPEGIAVSVPLYFATGSKKKALGFSFLSGLAEPIGALIGYTILAPFFNELTFGLLFASVAGIMVYISLDELLPTAEKYGEHHIAIFGVIGGMAVMALSLLLFA